MLDSIFSGLKTAHDVYNCMVKNDCEKVPKYGYGYTDVTEKSCPVNAPCQKCAAILFLLQISQFTK